MTIWKHTPSPDDLNRLGENCAVGHLGIEIIEIGDDYLKARMPVDQRTHQPYGLLHGGASILLAETLGSTAALLAAGADDHVCVGQEINGNHVRGVREGWVYGVVRPCHIGRSSHVWSIDITDEQDRLVCVSRMTVAVLAKPSE